MDWLQYLAQDGVSTICDVKCLAMPHWKSTLSCDLLHLVSASAPPAHHPTANHASPVAALFPQWDLCLAHCMYWLVLCATLLLPLALADALYGAQAHQRLLQEPGLVSLINAFHQLHAHADCRGAPGPLPCITTALLAEPARRMPLAEFLAGVPLPPASVHWGTANFPVCAPFVRSMPPVRLLCAPLYPRL